MSMFYNPCQNHSLLLAANAYGLIDCHWLSARSNMDHHCSGCRPSLTQTQAPAARRRAGPTWLLQPSAGNRTA